MPTPDPLPLPANADFLFIPSPVNRKKLQAILDGIESFADEHPVDVLYPTNRWVTHVYSAVTPAKQQGYVILHDVPPFGDTGKQPVQIELVTGKSEAEKAEKARHLIGRGNELIGYEDFDGPERLVIFRITAAGALPDPRLPDSLSWDNVPERKEWSKALIALVAKVQVDLEKANPEAFIAGYNGLATNALKIKFWAEILVAMAKFESNWKPTDVYHEPAPLDVYSIGLLQLSRQDQGNYTLQPHINHENELKQPLINLQWGVTIFAHLLARDGVVASGSKISNARGAARYWSVLWTGHKIDLIKELTKTNVGL